MQEKERLTKDFWRVQVACWRYWSSIGKSTKDQEPKRHEYIFN